MMIDTGFNTQEGHQTLLLQQKRMLDGKRCVQMFPKGTAELPLPHKMERLETPRGVFHYNPEEIDANKILKHCIACTENEILELGPFNKHDVMDRVFKGENLQAVTEYTPLGVEVRSAAGTESTVDQQLVYFEKTKDRENIIVIGPFPDRVRNSRY